MKTPEATSLPPDGEILDLKREPGETGHLAVLISPPNKDGNSQRYYLTQDLYLQVLKLAKFGGQTIGEAR